MTNALAGETSPYLRQHRENPVDWLPWGDTALRQAHELDRPLLVSIGYSACHWCHVMERECFEDEAIAALMNEHFVCVKVDREERPDLDAIYMEALQAMSGHGGWPLNVFLTPDGAPIFGGTYFPPEARPGMPSFSDVLLAIAEIWRDRRDEALAAGARLAGQLGGAAALVASKEPIDARVLGEAIANLRQIYEPKWGGFGGAPKFPPASVIEFLLAHGETQMALHTLRSMASGGINDQVGGGFSRYSVDATWTVPHFEKMLYDNALLARDYLHGWLRSGDAVLRRTCEETLDFILAELQAPDGGFCASLDADSEGVEGRFYVWKLGELEEELGELTKVAVAYFGATERGNFEGSNVLEARGPEPSAKQRQEIRARLLDARARRVRPALDDKRLTSWNALAIGALADAGAVLGEPRYLEAAVDCADFVLRELRDSEGRLLRTFNDGRAQLLGYLEDHAYLVEALLTLYEASFEERFFVAARALAEEMLRRFHDAERGGFFTTASDHERLIVRRKEIDDTPIPSGSSSAILGLLRLSALTGEESYRRHGVDALRLTWELAPRHPVAFGHLLRAIDLHGRAVREVALVGDGLEALADVVRGTLRPEIVLAGSRTSTEASAVPLLANRDPVDGRAAAYVCERFACQAPVTEPEELAALLATGSAGSGRAPTA